MSFQVKSTNSSQGDISQKSYQKPPVRTENKNNNTYLPTNMSETTAPLDLTDIHIVPFKYEETDDVIKELLDEKSPLLEDQPLGFTADKIRHLQVSLPALAKATGMTTEELIACPPNKFRKRLEHVYSTKAREEADKLFLAEAKPIEETIEQVVNDFKDLYAEVQKVSKRMSMAYNLTEEQRFLLTQWKDGNRERSLTYEEIEFIIEWSDSYAKDPLSSDSKDLLREWMKPFFTRIQGISEFGEVSSARNWLNEQKVICEMGVQSIKPDDIKRIEDKEKETFFRWKNNEVISDEDIQIILNYLRSAKTLENKAILLALLKKRASPPYTKKDGDLIASMTPLRMNFKFTYGSFNTVLDGLHKKFHSYQKIASDARKELDGLTKRWTEERIAKDRNMSNPLKNQMVVLNTAAVRYNKVTSPVVDDLEITHKGTKALSDALAEMEEKLSDIEENKNWFYGSTNWNFKRELSRCCYCSACNYDTNSYCTEFDTSYKRGYYKYAEKPKLEFDDNGIVILIDQIINTNDNV